MEKENDSLKVESPRSLLRKTTMNMYLPRNDKFEGYSQFPRPKLPPESKKFDSFISKRPKMPGEIYRGDLDKSFVPLSELLERQA